MRRAVCLTILAVLTIDVGVRAQTSEDITKLIQRLVELDSMELAEDVKFRAGLRPSLHKLDADEAGMKVLQNPYEVHGKDEPGAAGWYRIHFTVPPKLGKFPVPPGGFNLGVESNCLGAWEIYTYLNGKPVGSALASGVSGVVTFGNVLSTSRQPPTAWMSNAPIPARPGDKITVAILATSAPLGRGSPEGFGLRLLRLRFALGHTFARQPFFGSVTAPGMGTGLHGAREMLATRKGEELKALQTKLQGPLDRLENVFRSAESGRLDDLSAAMRVATKEINDALKK